MVSNIIFPMILAVFDVSVITKL